MASIKELENKYGWVSIDQIHGSHFQKYIYPSDLEILNSQRLNDAVFRCIGAIDEDFLILESTEITLHLKKEVFRLMPVQPQFKPLEKVKYLSSKGKLEFGKVAGIDWHNKEHKHIYDLEVNGKVKSRRFYEEDLQKLEE